MKHVMTPLDLVEQQFDQVAAFLAAGNAIELETASKTLQTLSTDLAKLLQNSPPTSLANQKALRQRVRSLAAGLQMLRDNLSRRAALNQQALQVVVPTPSNSTYGGGSSVYGAVAHQAVVHKYLAA